MKLIVAEKPSQARDIASAIGGFENKAGYMQNPEYFITWCRGHLIELAKDDQYREPGNWNKSYLPLLPATFKYKIGEGKTDQVKVIGELMKKASSIINATDADREGELIFLYVYNYLNCKLPYERLWLNSLTENDIRKGMQKLQKPEVTKNLGKSAYARAIADWLVGVNGTQASTLQLGGGKLLTIGRVQTAILKIICERFIKNKKHQVTYSYRLVASHDYKGVKFLTESDVIDEKEKAQKLFNSLEAFHKCDNVSVDEVASNPPLLYNIDDLIIDANKCYQFSSKKTLDIAQSLYEKKLTSYPRTDSNYINEENFSNIRRFLPKFSQDLFDAEFSFLVDKPKSVNDQKLTGSHDAIVPTGSLKEWDKTSDDEKKIFYLVTQRCMQSFSTPAIFKKSKYTFINQVPFYYRSSMLMVPGWKSFEFVKKSEVAEDVPELSIPVLKGDDVAVIRKNVRQIESKPPAIYTDASLTSDLTNIKKFLETEYNQVLEGFDTAKLELGTQATRPYVIERLKKLEFIEKQKNKIVPTDKGLSYYEAIRDLKISDVATTAVWEYKLQQIAEGRLSDDIFYLEINDYVKNIVEEIFKIQKGTVNVSNINKLGTCPKCGKGTIVEGKKAYGCDQFRSGCDFVIWKEIAGKNITETVAKQLITKKKSSLVKNFISKAGKKFDAFLKLDDSYKVIFEFEKK